MVESANQIMIIFIVLLCCLRESRGYNSSELGDSKILCKEAERRALLKIKAGLIEYEENALSSWGEEESKRECCEWIGIRCYKKSGHVAALDLSSSTFGYPYYAPLMGNYISSSLVHLEHLSYLNLSGVVLSGISFPIFISNLSRLKYLDLSSTSLTGQVPSQLGNLPGLKFLDLSVNDLGWESLGWVSRLSSLQVLNLAFTDFSTSYDWVQVFGNLPHLTKLVLKSCSLPKVVIPSSLSLSNSSKVLAFLDLSENSLSGSIFQWLLNFDQSLIHLDLSYCSLTSYSIGRAFENMVSLEYVSLASNLLEGSILTTFSNITTLKYLDLSSNKLEGSISESFRNWANLEHLNLFNNTLYGEIPKSIWEICNIELRCNNLSGNPRFSFDFLDLSSNHITGTLPDFTMYPNLTFLILSSNRLTGIVPETISQLSKLVILDISKNSLTGVISEAHFSKLYSMNLLDLSYNQNLVVNISSHWIPQFQLNSIYLRSCQLGPHFPNWLQTQNRLSNLDISNSQISDPIPDWFWNSSTDIKLVNLSNNQIIGSIKDQHLPFGSSHTIDLSSNKLEGPIPLFLLQVRASYLSHNKFSSLSSICNASDDSLLSLLDVSYNNLEGQLPDCWSNFNALGSILLSSNNLSGNIPRSLGSISGIELLDLSNNSFTGNLPQSLSKSSLIVLDLAENRLVGPVPKWVGLLEKLVILNLRSNNFSGSFPSSLCSLRYIQFLDMSSNNIAGKIPSCVDNLAAMRKNGNLKGHGNIFDFGDGRTSINLVYGLSRIYAARVTIMWKGKLYQYKNTLQLVKSINLSNNKLVGKIPKEITELDGLIALDLSINWLTGQIPVDIGNLKSLEVLDLSRNHLSGKIPPSLSALNFMSMLDVSNNNLSGKIPTSTQLQSLDPSSYSGNLELCGAPLPKKCQGEEPTASIGSDNSINNVEDGEESYISRGFFVSLGLGFVVGFWGICGSLLFIKSWRYAYFIFLNGIGDWLYVTIVLYKTKIQRMIKP